MLVEGGVGLGVGTRTPWALMNGYPRLWPLVTDMAANGHGGGSLSPVIDGGVGGVSGVVWRCRGCGWRRSNVTTCNVGIVLIFTRKITCRC